MESLWDSYGSPIGCDWPHLVGALDFDGFCLLFPWEFSNPNPNDLIFLRGVFQPPTSRPLDVQRRWSQHQRLQLCLRVDHRTWWTTAGETGRRGLGLGKWLVKWLVNGWGNGWWIGWWMVAYVIECHEWKVSVTILRKIHSLEFGRSVFVSTPEMDQHVSQIQLLDKQDKDKI